MSGSFLDTNIILYSASNDPAKAQRARDVIAAGGMINIQVLNETVSVARRKMRMPWSEIRDILTSVRSLLDVRPLTITTHEMGLDLSIQHNLSIYDSMIVAAALEADCDVLWSEDMQHGMIFAGRLRVANPFAA
jgi:predicted nucleic acid-binding protein